MNQLKPFLRYVLFVLIGIYLVILYVVYLPLSVIHTITDLREFVGFAEGVNDCITNILHSLRRGAK